MATEQGSLEAQTERVAGLCLLAVVHAGIPHCRDSALPFLLPYSNLYFRHGVPPHAFYVSTLVLTTQDEGWHACGTCGYRKFRPNLKTRSEEHTSELQSRLHLVCRLLLEKKKRSTMCSYSTLLAVSRSGYPR